MPNYKTIRQTKILPEHRLRLMLKQGKLPGIQVGNRFPVNVDLLEKQLEQESRLAVKKGDDKNENE